MWHVAPGGICAACRSLAMGSPASTAAPKRCHRRPISGVWFRPIWRRSRGHCNSRGNPSRSICWWSPTTCGDPSGRLLLDSLAPGGLLIYETFALGNAQFGKPSRPDYLLRPGELLDVCRDLHIVAYENGYLAQPARLVQRIAALRPGLASPNAVWPGPALSLE
jgi:hypothetical protein